MTDRSQPDLNYIRPTLEFYAKVLAEIRELNFGPLIEYGGTYRTFWIRFKGDPSGHYDVRYSNLNLSIIPLQTGPKFTGGVLKIELEVWKDGLRVKGMDCSLYEVCLLEVLGLLKTEFSQK